MQIDLESITPTAALELYLTDRRGDGSAWTICLHRSRLSTFLDRMGATVAAATGDCREAPPCACGPHGWPSTKPK